MLSTAPATLLAVLLLTLAAQGADEPATHLLWPDGAPGAVGQEDKDQPKLIVHLPPADRNTGAAVVILPGGGYGGLAMGHEGSDMAAWFNSLGMAACVTDYRHRGKGYGHPAPLNDAQRAIRTVRARAEEWRIDPRRVGVIGFSAGGHLASCTGVYFDSGDERAADPIDRQSCRPDYLILCYPVISFGAPQTHLGSQRNLLGPDAPPELIESLSTEKHVRADSPPTFLWHTAENSVQFFLGLRKAGVPCELHLFERGRHGLGLAQQTPGADRWPDLCRQWLTQRGILGNENAAAR
jgi:acetyl esterase/lipase